MNESEYDALMKKGLFDDGYWSALIDSPEDREQAAEWLRRTVQQVRADLKRRKALWSGTPHRSGSPDWHRARKAYHSWRASALGFEQALVNRMFELDLNEQGHPKVKAPAAPRPVDEAVARARSHAERIEQDQKHVTRSLVALVVAVESFAAGDMTTRDLQSHLDLLTVPHNGNETKTVRELAAAMTAAYASVGSA